MARAKGSKNYFSLTSSAYYEKQISGKEKDVVTLKSKAEKLNADTKDKQTA